MRTVFAVAGSAVFVASLTAAPAASALSPVKPLPIVQEYATPIASARAYDNRMPCVVDDSVAGDSASVGCDRRTVVSVVSSASRCWMFARAHVVSVVDSTATIRLTGWARPGFGRDRCFSGHRAYASVSVSGTVTKVIDFATGQAVSLTRYETR